MLGLPVCKGPSEVPVPAFSVQFCSISDVSKPKFWTGYETGISWKKRTSLWAWCGKLHSRAYAWEAFVLGWGTALSWDTNHFLPFC